MKRLIHIFVFGLTFFGCISQNQYFELKGIDDKTEEYATMNKDWTADDFITNIIDLNTDLALETFMHSETSGSY